MKRRTFIWISTVSAVSIILPFGGCISGSGFEKILATPISLSHIFTSEIMNEIGNKYKRLVPKEAKKEILVKLLLKVENGKYLSGVSLENLLKENIKKDFKENNVMVLDGWILSITEARQCTFYHIINT